MLFFDPQQSVFLSVCILMVLIMNIYAVVKEVVQISQQVLTCIYAFMAVSLL